MASEPTTAAEMAQLRNELSEVKTRIAQLEQQRNDAIDALAQATGLTRRQVLGIVAGGASMGALGVLASGEARGAASSSDSDGDVGTTTSRADLFTDGINYNVAAISSATTVSAPVVRYDCSVSGFTITLDSALEPSDGTQCVVLIDETGSAGSNQVTVDTQSGNNIDGGANITINHNHAVTVLWFDSSEWRSTRFIDTVDARQFVGSEISTPSTPASGKNKLYFKSDDNLYKLDDGGNENQVGANPPISIPDNTLALDFADDAGAEQVGDMGVTSSPAAGTEESLAVAVDGTDIIKAYAEADGAGGIQNQQGRFPDGDLDHPGIAFEGDPDTGVHRSGADTMQWVTGGDAEMELTSGGNLNLEGTLTESTTV